jgi:hypothetical protein
MRFELPRQYQSSSNRVSYLGAAFFGLTTIVLIYQIYFYNKSLKSMKSEGDISERIKRLEDIIISDKES